MYLRWKGDGHQAVGIRRWTIQSRHASMNVTIQLIVYVEVALILQRRAACGALETLNMEILILNSHKHTTNEFIRVFSVRYGPVRRGCG